jgi:acyl carrier protein
VEQTERRITDFIVQNYLFGDATAIPERTVSLVEQGIVDSTGILEMIDFLEAEFGIVVEDSEAIPDNLGSIANITDYVQRKTG